MDRNWVAVALVGVVSLGLVVNGFLSAVNPGILLSPGSGNMGYVVFIGALSMVVVLLIGAVFNRR